MIHLHPLVSGVLLAAVATATAKAQTLVRDLTPASGSSTGSAPGVAVVAGGVAWFAATDAFGRELWRTDCTPLGTS